jgi:centromere/kinetochore protein ZW10
VASTGPREGQIKILQALHANYRVLHDKLVADVAKAWLDIVKWDLSKVDGEKKKKNLSVKTTLCIKVDADQKDVIANVVQAMKDLKILSQKLNNFGDRLIKSLIEPVLSCSDLQIKLDKSKESRVLALTGGSQEKSRSDVVLPHSALEQISQVMTFLHEHLFFVEVKSENTGPDGDASGNVSLMTLLGSFVDKELVDLIITKSLSHSIPSNSRDLEEFKEIIHKTEAFQNMLIKIGFLRSDNTILSDYVNDVNTLFANKKCREILEKAQSLMTSEIHNMLQITPVSTEDLPPVGLEGTSKRSKSETTPFSGDTTLSMNTFQLPACYIR